MKQLPIWALCLVAGVVFAGCAKSVEPDAGTKQGDTKEVTEATPAEAAPAKPGDHSADKVAKTEFAVGKPAPDFEVTDTKRESLKLADYRGKVVVLDYWALW